MVSCPHSQRKHSITAKICFISTDMTSNKRDDDIDRFLPSVQVKKMFDSGKLTSSII